MFFQTARPVNSRTAPLMILFIAGMLLSASGCSSNAASSTATATPTAAPPTARATEDHSGHQHATESASTATASAPDTPHYFADPEKAKPYPKTLDPKNFQDPAVRAAYAVAQRIPDVLVQQPCYCYCDQGFGHGSLLHCHIDDHSAG